MNSLVTGADPRDVGEFMNVPLTTIGQEPTALPYTLVSCMANEGLQNCHAQFATLNWRLPSVLAIGHFGCWPRAGIVRTSRSRPSPRLSRPRTTARSIPQPLARCRAGNGRSLPEPGLYPRHSRLRKRT